MATENTFFEYLEFSHDVVWKEFEFAADAWQWLDEQGFRACAVNHLSFDHADGSTALLCLPVGESADEPTAVKIHPSRKSAGVHTL